MKILCLIGLNHKTAAIDIRERYFMSPLERELLLAEFKADPNILEVFVLSTCNRIEIYAHMLLNRPESLFAALSRVKKISISQDDQSHFYQKHSQEVVEHLFEVACGLDSLVIGEKQILGQVKDAADLSRQAGLLGTIFNVLTNIVVSAGKTAQAKTQISRGGSSVSWAAVMSAQKILQRLDDKSILIIGAGKMSQLTAGQLARKSVSKVYVTNRTFKNAQSLARSIGAEPVMFWDLKNVLTTVDVCICSSGASYFLIERELIAEVMQLRNHRPLLLIDISTPRNIDPQTALVNGVRLVSIDDLDQLIQENLNSRQTAVDDVKQIIQQKIDFFNKSIYKCEHPAHLVYSS